MNPKRDKGLVVGFAEGNSDNWLDAFAFSRAVEPMAAIRGADWARELMARDMKPYPTAADTYLRCQLQGLRTLQDSVDVSPELRGGVPVLRGTRFTVAQLLAELSETNGPAEIADNFDLNEAQIKSFLNGLALLMHKSHVR